MASWAFPKLGGGVISNKVPQADIEQRRAEDIAGRSALSRSLAKYVALIAIAVALIALAAIFAPAFFSLRNFANVLQQMAIIGVVTIGMHCVIVTGGIDLSVGSILELVTIVFAFSLEAGFSQPIAIAFGLLLGCVAGLCNGLGITVLRIQPFVITLATLAIYHGLTLTLSNGSLVPLATSALSSGGTPVQVHSALLDFIGNGIILFFALAVIAWIVLRYLPFGRYLYAVGGSEETARLSGIRVSRVLVGAYVISGATAGLAGIMTAARLGVGVPTAGSLTNLDAIAAVVVGGTSLTGGRGSLWGSVAGALVLAVIANLIILVGFSPFHALIIRGLVIVAAVSLSSLGARSSPARRKPASGA
jgi:ribose transport system permease protein